MNTFYVVSVYISKKTITQFDFAFRFEDTLVYNLTTAYHIVKYL